MWLSACVALLSKSFLKFGQLSNSFRVVSEKLDGRSYVEVENVAVAVLYHQVQAKLHVDTVNVPCDALIQGLEHLGAKNKEL